jgi:flagellar protein FliS
MTQKNAQLALSQYSNTAVQAGVAAASPHRLIQMLMEGALDKIAIAKGYLARGQMEQKGKHIGWAISIVGGLRSSLDLDRGGEIARNLDDLYDYMDRRLVTANVENSIEILDEVTALLRQIKEAWDAIGGQVSTQPGVSSSTTLPLAGR